MGKEYESGEDLLPDQNPNKLGELSPQLRQLLEEEAAEAEVQSAIDAALEEGIFLTRGEAIDLLNEKMRKEKDTDSSSSDLVP